MRFDSCTRSALRSLAPRTLWAVIALAGCSNGARPPAVETAPSPVASTEAASPEPPGDAQATASAAPAVELPPAPSPSATFEEVTTKADPPGPPAVAVAPAAAQPDVPTTAEASVQETAISPASAPPAERPTLADLLAKLQVPPPWLAGIQTQWDTAKPWKDARLEVRRLLGFGRVETHREALKITWVYLQKNDIGDGHEVPMYTFLGGEPVWSVRAHEEYLAKPHENSPTHAYLTLASLYTQFGEFEKAKATLDVAMKDIPGPPWQIMRQADVLDGLGDVYAAWGKLDEAKHCYAQSAVLYPTAKPPYGGHLLPRRAVRVQSKLDLLTFRSLESATLRDGQYQAQTVGYAGDMDVAVTIRQGKLADIRLKHEEKIDQNACVLIPQRIIAAQSLQVDGVSGATVTKEAIVDGVYQCLKKAGLK